MTIEVREEPVESLTRYADISIAFDVREILTVTVPENQLEGLRFHTQPLAAPYRKDYDAFNHPRDWATRFDLSRWTFLSASRAGTRLGGAAIAQSDPLIRLFEDRSDLALLWDLRVAPEARGQGVGQALFQAAEQWATAHGARWLKIETQNTNVPACRFYARQGCTLGALNRFAYPSLPEEVQLLWYKQLA